MKETNKNLSNYKLSHVGIVVKDLNKTVKALEALGIGPFEKSLPPEGAEGLYFRGKLMDSKFQSVRTRIGNLELEIFEPDALPSPQKEFLDETGGGLHHLGFTVEDVEKEVNKLAEKGAEVTLTGKRHGELAAAYLDLKTDNIFIELMNF